MVNYCGWIVDDYFGVFLCNVACCRVGGARGIPGPAGK